jgi:hypothetical protein
VSKFHFHVYKVVSEAEVDIEATDWIEGIDLAIAKAAAGKLTFVKGGRKHIATAFDWNGGSGAGQAEKKRK